MHYTNNLLPDFVKDGIQDDVHLLQSMKNNIAEMNQMLKELLDIPTSLLNRVDKSIHIYLKLFILIIIYITSTCIHKVYLFYIGTQK